MEVEVSGVWVGGRRRKARLSGCFKERRLFNYKVC